MTLTNGRTGDLPVCERLHSLTVNTSDLVDDMVHFHPVASGRHSIVRRISPSVGQPRTCVPTYVPHLAVAVTIAMQVRVT